MKKFWKTMLTSLALIVPLAFGQTTRSPSTTLIQLGVDGVTATGGTVNQSNRLVKTGNDGMLDSSLLPSLDTLLPKFGETYFIDAAEGVDAASRGAISAPMATLQYALDNTDAHAAVYILPPGMNTEAISLYEPSACTTNVTILALDPAHTEMSGRIDVYDDPVNLTLDGVVLAVLNMENGGSVRLLRGASVVELTGDDITVYRDPVSVAPIAGAPYTEELIHDAAEMSYTGGEAWTNNLYGVDEIPDTIAGALDALVMQEVMTNGVRSMDLLVWDDTISRWVPHVGITNYNTKAEDAANLAAALLDYSTTVESSDAFIDEDELSDALDNYYDSATSDSRFVLQSVLPTVLGDYYTANQIDAGFYTMAAADAEFIDQLELTAALLGYPTLEDMGEYVTYAALGTTLDDYSTTAEADVLYVDPTELGTALSDYYTKAAADTRFIDTNELTNAWATLRAYTNDFVSVSSLATTLGNYYTTSAAHNVFYTKTQVSNLYLSTNAFRLAMANYFTTNQARALFYTRDQVGANFVSNATFVAFTSAFPSVVDIAEQYVDVDELADLMESYSDTITISNLYVRKTTLESDYIDAAEIAATYATQDALDALVVDLNDHTSFPNGLVIGPVLLTTNSDGRFTRDGHEIYDAEDFDFNDLTGLGLREETAAVGPGWYLLAGGAGYGGLPTMTKINYDVAITNASFGVGERLLFNVIWHGNETTTPIAQVFFDGKQRFPPTGASLIGTDGLRVGDDGVYLQLRQAGNTLTVQATGPAAALPTLPLALSATGPGLPRISMTESDLLREHQWNDAEFMQTTTWDVNDNGAVDDADALGGNPASEYLHVGSALSADLNMGAHGITNLAFLRGTGDTADQGIDMLETRSLTTDLWENWNAALLEGRSADDFVIYGEPLSQALNMNGNAISNISMLYGPWSEWINWDEHTVSSDAVWTNLNADLLDGYSAGHFMPASMLDNLMLKAASSNRVVTGDAMVLANHGAEVTTIDAAYTGEAAAALELHDMGNVNILYNPSLITRTGSPQSSGTSIRFPRDEGLAQAITYVPALNGSPQALVAGSSVRLAIRAAFPSDATLVTAELGGNTVLLVPTVYGTSLTWHEFYLPITEDAISSSFTIAVTYPGATGDDVLINDVLLFKGIGLGTANAFVWGDLQVNGQPVLRFVPFSAIEDDGEPGWVTYDETSLYWWNEEAGDWLTAEGESGSPLLSPGAPVFSDQIDDGFTVSWAERPTATGYAIDVSEVSDFATFVTGDEDYEDFAVAGTTLDVGGLDMGTIYYVRLRAEYAGGTSPSGPVGYTTTTSSTAPDAPGDITISGTTAYQFVGSWDPVGGAAAYRVDVATDEDFTLGTFVSGYEDVETVPNSITVAGLTPGNTYYIVARSTNSYGASANSTTSSVTTLLPAPARPMIANVGYTNFVVSWTSVGAANYLLDVSDDAGFVTYVTGYEDRSVAGTAITVTNLMPGETYYVRVLAEYVGGSSAESDVQTQTTKALLPPAAPYTVGTIMNTSIPIGWDTVLDATSYRFDAATDVSFGETTLAGYSNRVVSGTALSVAELTSGQTYWFRVRAVYPAGTSTYSSVTSVTTPVLAAPAQPTITDVITTNFTLNWTAVAGALSYKVDMSKDPAFGTTWHYANFPATGTSLRMTNGISADTDYYVRLAAVYAAGTSDESLYQFVHTALAGPPPPPTYAFSDISEIGFRISWSKVTLPGSPASAQYILRICTDYAGLTPLPEWDDVNVGAVLYKDICDLDPGTTYYVFLRSFDDRTNAPTYGRGEQSGPQTQATLGAGAGTPLAPTVENVLAHSATINWTHAPGCLRTYLDVATDSAFTEYVPGYQNKDMVAAATANLVNLDMGDDYYVRIRQLHRCGNTTPNSEMLGFQTLNIPPPEEFTASAQTISNAVVTWPRIPGAIGYSVQVYHPAAGAIGGSVTYDLDQTYTVATETFTLTNMPPNDGQLGVWPYNGGAYGIKVATITDIDTGDYSDMAEIASAELELVDGPELVLYGATTTNMLATWSVFPYAYPLARIEVSTDNFQTFIPGYSDTGTYRTQPVLITGLTENVTYDVRVRPIYWYTPNCPVATPLPGAYSDTEQLKTLALPAPEGFGADVLGGTDGTTVNLVWDELTSPTPSEFRLDVRTTAGAYLEGYYNKLIGAGETSEELTVPLAGQSYVATLRAVYNSPPYIGASPNATYTAIVPAAYGTVTMAQTYPAVSGETDPILYPVNARWRADNGDWYAMGANQTLMAGVHTISYTDDSYYWAATSHTISVEANVLTSHNTEIRRVLMPGPDTPTLEFPLPVYHGTSGANMYAGVPQYASYVSYSADVPAAAKAQVLTGGFTMRFVYDQYGGSCAQVVYYPLLPGNPTFYMLAQFGDNTIRMSARRIANPQNTPGFFDNCGLPHSYAFRGMTMMW